MPLVIGRAAGLPTGGSARRTERGIALVAPAMRTVLLIQIGLGYFSGVRLARDQLAYTAITVAVVVVSIGLIVQCLASGSVRAGWWHLPDLALAWLSYPVLVLSLPKDVLTGTWAAWVTAFAVNVAAISGGWLRPSLAIGNGFALAAWGFSWIGLPTHDWEARISDALTIPAYSIVVALLAGYLRALAEDADRAREEAVVATRALELQRYQLTVHDASSILRLLSDAKTPAEVLPGLRVQGHREANRLRHYLGAPTPTSGPAAAHTVGTMLSCAMTGFDDLPLEPAIELGAHVVLSEQVWLATSRAVATVLHNARLHARANQVVVHADTEEHTWEVVVSDDGVGFDQTDQPLGFGLGVQVRRALEGLGITVAIASTPGRGTSVTIRGPVTAS